jgi:hypothetical protein
MAFLEYRPRQPLYQYCSVSAFYGIISSKSLWFSDLALANDPRELDLGLEYFIQALRSVRHDEYKGEAGLFLSVLAGNLASYKANVAAYCACFSLAGDELPMWGAYAANHTGLAVGFRPTAILAIPARVQKVNYVADTAFLDFRRLVLDLAAEMRGGLHDEEYWISAAIRAFAAITALKHSSWSYEQEIRVVHVQPLQAPDPLEDRTFALTGLLPDGSVVEWAKPLERDGAFGKVRYLQFPFGRYREGGFDPRRAIAEVIIGPNCSLTEQQVAKAMCENGFEEFEVKLSACSIRSPVMPIRAAV